MQCILQIGLQKSTRLHRTVKVHPKTYVDLSERFQTNVVYNIPVKQHNSSLIYTLSRKRDP